MKTELKKLIADKLLQVLADEGIVGNERKKVLSYTYGMCRKEAQAKELEVAGNEN